MKEPAVKDNLSKEIKKKRLDSWFPAEGNLSGVREYFKVPSYMC
jgi:hypothetical protein